MLSKSWTDPRTAGGDVADLFSPLSFCFHPFFFVTPKLVQETIRLVCNTEVFGSTPFMRHYSITIIFKHLRNSYKIAAAFTLFESSLSQSIKPRLRNHNNFGGFWHLHQLAPQLDPDQSRTNPSINQQSAAEEPQFP
jgi:hypothetical protein